MSRVITTLKLRNFRSFENETVCFPNPAFLVGRNGAGKSGVLDAIQLLADCASVPLATALQLRGGISSVRHRASGSGKAPKMALLAEVQPFGSDEWRFRYGFELEPRAGKGFSVSREICQRFRAAAEATECRPDCEVSRVGDTISSNLGVLLPRLDSGSLALPFLIGIEEFGLLGSTMEKISVIHPQTSQIRELQTPSPNRLLDRTAGNLASILEEMFAGSHRSSIDRLNKFLEKVAEHTAVVRPVQRGSRLSVQFEQLIGAGKVGFDASSMSDGTLRTLGILASVFQPTTPSVLCVEEPEASVHPGALDVVLDALAFASSQSHLIVSTQSPQVLDNPLVTGESIRVVQWSKGSSRILPASKESLRAISSHLFGAGELLQANQLLAESSSSKVPSFDWGAPWSSN